MNELERLAAGFVECTTQWDYAPLPDAVKQRLLDAAKALLEWQATQGTYVISSDVDNTLVSGLA